MCTNSTISNVLDFVNASISDKYLYILRDQMGKLQDIYSSQSDDESRLSEYDSIMETYRELGGFNNVFYDVCYSVEEMRDVIDEFFNSNYDFMLISDKNIEYFNKAEDTAALTLGVMNRRYVNVDISIMKSLEYIEVLVSDMFSFSIRKRKEEQ